MLTVIKVKVGALDAGVVAAILSTRDFGVTPASFMACKSCWRSAWSPVVGEGDAGGVDLPPEELEPSPGVVVPPLAIVVLIGGGLGKGYPNLGVLGLELLVESGVPDCTIR